MFDRILVATDGSPGATNAVRAALALAALGKAPLTVLNVFDTDVTTGPRSVGPREFARAEHLQGDQAEAKEILSQDILRDAQLLAKQHGVEASFVSLDGDAADEIVRYAAEIGADTIVLGSRGRGRVVGLLLGSVSQKVANHAPQMTLIVPPPKQHS